jgi:hypothetical protein
VLAFWQYLGSGHLNPGDVLLAAGVERLAPPRAREVLLDVRRAGLGEDRAGERADVADRRVARRGAPRRATEPGGERMKCISGFVRSTYCCESTQFRI